MRGRIGPEAVAALLDVARAQAERGVRGGVGVIGAGDRRLAVLLALIAGAREGMVVVDTEPAGAGAGAERRSAIAALRADLARFLLEPDLVAIIGQDGVELAPGDLVDAADGPLRLVDASGAETDDGARRRLALAAGALAPGGVVIANGAAGAARADALTLLLEPGGPALVPFAAGGGRMLLTGSEADAAAYRRGLAGTSARARQARRGALAGHEVVVIGDAAG